MVMLRVYMDIEGSAPEPIGVVHQDCQPSLPSEDDGHELTTDFDPFDEHHGTCQVCGEDG